MQKHRSLNRDASSSAGFANNCKFSVIELFAGAGGLALGLEQAGFNSLALLEYDKDAVKTLRENRPNWNIIHDDIANISCQNLTELFDIEVGELDLLSGGAPCQSFSYAGKRLGLEDARGTLFYHFAVFLKKLQPKTFLFENVRGLLTHDQGRTYQTMLDIFSETGYTIQRKVLNAWSYGVPQKRERLITLGVRNDLNNKLSINFPTPYDYKPVLRDVLLDVPESIGAQYSDYKRKIFSMVPPGGYWRDVPKDIAKEYMKSCWEMGGGRTGILRRLSLDEPSLTVLTSPSQKQTERCHPLEARPFSIRENARCQSFPDDWIFCGSVGSQYRQVGNAVPVNLAREIAQEIRKGLEMITFGDDYMWEVTFIAEEDFRSHVQSTIEQYGDKLIPYDLTKFNLNIVDPIKMIFDKTVYSRSWEDIIDNEIFRQRDKSTNNDIGYFHQRIFQFIAGCEVPDYGWDVIFEPDGGFVLPNGERVRKVFVEMKNKHNTMNSSSSAKTYMKMQGQLLEDDDCACFLVEVIAKKSQDIPWAVSVDGTKRKHNRIRRVSIDEFYRLVTGQDNAFYQICMALPEVIESVLQTSRAIVTPQDTVMEELRKVAVERDGSIALALYLLGFNSYHGFRVE